MPPAAPTLSCAAVRVAELARIGQRIWRRFASVSASVSSYLGSLRGLTGALAYVRSGSRQIAGATTPGPPRLPRSGSVRYRGTAYQVRSFSARLAGAPARVYQLIP